MRRPAKYEFIRLGLMLSCWILPGCETEPNPVKLYDIGDPCRPYYSFCLDLSHVQRCIDNEWSVDTCETVCAEDGMVPIPEACEADVCECTVVDPNGCTPGDAMCASIDALSLCDDTQTWVSHDCEQVCEYAGLESVGCMEATEESAASCWCTSEATPCDVGEAPACVDETAIAICENGAWMVVVCAEACGGPAQCVPGVDTHECECM